MLPRARCYCSKEKEETFSELLLLVSELNPTPEISKEFL